MQIAGCICTKINKKKGKNTVLSVKQICIFFHNTLCACVCLLGKSSQMNRFTLYSVALCKISTIIYCKQVLYMQNKKEMIELYSVANVQFYLVLCMLYTCSCPITLVTMISSTISSVRHLNTLNIRKGKWIFLFIF